MRLQIPYNLIMSKKDKLVKRFLAKPSDFTFSELKTLLSYLGYTEFKAGKTAGSRVAFKSSSEHIIRIHRPHPNNELKRYQIDFLIDDLKKRGLIE